MFVQLVADGWCWFVLREKYCWLIDVGWFVLREKYCWLVADKPSEQGARLREEGGRFSAILVRAACRVPMASSSCAPSPWVTNGSSIMYGSTLPSCIFSLLLPRFPSHNNM
jgi:hypothetical protein